MKILHIVAFMLGLAASTATVHAQQTPAVTVREMKDLAASGQAVPFTQMLQTAIASTGKFRVIEADFAQLRDQQELGNSGMVTTNRPNKRGGFEGASYLIYGAITAGSAGQQADNEASTGRALARSVFGVDLGGNNCSKSVANLGVDIKIVDGNTGEIRYAKFINQQSVGKTSCSGDTDLDLGNLLRLAANDIASGLVTTIYPIKIAAVQPDGTLMLNYGEGTLNVGQYLAVFSLGETVLDPDTGKPLSNEGVQIGTIRVTEVTPKFSRAVADQPSVQPFQVGYISRPVALPAPTKKGKRK